MRTTSMEVYIYVTSKEWHKFAPEITDQLNQLDGVVNVSVNEKIKDLLMVKYEPESISALKILSTYRKNGHSGSLVGM
ncbi:MAG: hypothetical protein OEY52_08965 [Gammaproteobacteria bacterium]|nr:hypothetical protein [Gammaproteobacteria bacterium]